MKKSLSFSEFSDKLFEHIDITPTQYKTAIAHSQAVEKCLIDGNAGEDVYVQGSFALGTVIRPIKDGADADFDIDLVCQGIENKNQTAPQYIKRRMKGCILASPQHAKLLREKEGKRCWTLDYACDDSGIGFHMDILPCVTESADIIDVIKQTCDDPEYADLAIAITDKSNLDSSYGWSSGNARGYAQWFAKVNEPYLATVSYEQKMKLVENRHYASINEVPDPLLRSSLQRVIQILKRHRDCRFSGRPDEDNKPISIIITTLVTQIAKRLTLHDAPVKDLLFVIVHQLARYADLQGDGFVFRALALPTDYFTRTVQDGWKIPNPVNPSENFAERWAENDHAKAKAFFRWISWAKDDFDFDGKDSGIMFDKLKVGFGEKTVEKIYRSLEMNALPAATPLSFTPATRAPKPYLKR